MKFVHPLNIDQVRARALEAETTNKEPSLTDQSAGKDTDLNVIMKKLITTGQMPSVQRDNIGDISGIPQDFRDMIHATREAHRTKEKLPKELQHLSLDELATLTNEQIAAILAPPPAKPDDKKPDEPKEPK